MNIFPTPLLTGIVLLFLTTAAVQSGAADATRTMPPEIDVMAELDRCLDRGVGLAVAAPACELVAARAARLDQSQRAALLHRRGQIGLAQRRFAAAVALLEQARALEPMVAPYYLTLGDALVANGEVPRAVAIYRRGDALAPTSKVFRARLEALARTAVAAKPGAAHR